MSHNAFQHGFAKQTDDPAIIAATTAKPGVVLKRAVGSSGPFQEHAELPRTLPNLKPPKLEKRDASKASRPKASTPEPEKTKKADVISFEKARANREKERAKEEARLDREREARRSAVQKAKAALQKAKDAYEAQIEVIEREREKLDQREEREKEKWASDRKRLEDAIAKAKR